MAHHVFTRPLLLSTLVMNTLLHYQPVDIAKLALGDGAVQDPVFCASIHRQSLDDQFGKEKSKEQMQKGDMEEPNFEGTEWDLIRAGAMEVDEQTGHNSDSDQTQELCDKIDGVTSTLKGMLQSGDPQLSSGVSKFIGRFDKLSAPRLRPKLASAFHQFGWEMGTTTITQGG